MNKKTIKNRNDKKERNLDHSVITHIKDIDLIERRRKEIVDAAVPLFIEKGFHKTTTRQIAKAANFSIGTLYEYVASKEDILYLVCASIHDDVKKSISDILSIHKEGHDALSGVIHEFFMICDRMSDVILLMYQEIHSLPKQWRNKVLANEQDITKILKNALRTLSSTGKFKDLGGKDINLIANNIAVLGHMWAFRRWEFRGDLNIEEYISLQTKFISQSYFENAEKTG